VYDVGFHPSTTKLSGEDHVAKEKSVRNDRNNRHMTSLDSVSRCISDGSLEDTLLCLMRLLFAQVYCVGRFTYDSVTEHKA